MASNIKNIVGDHLALITNRPTDSMFIPTLASNIQNFAGDPLDLNTNRPTDSMFIKPTDEQEINGNVRDLLPNKSPGLYDILPRVVRA